jgi:3-oxoacyl-[acyl-carrier-protein] synthase III
MRPAILTTGSSVPETVRGNDDPVFDWLRQHQTGSNLFTGYDERRVLAPGESIVDHMVAASRQALARANLSASDIDLIAGYCSISSNAMPNDLAAVAAQLQLNEHALVVPINCEYATFNQGLLVADALLQAGRVKRALIVVGANWSRYVDYTTPPSVSAADGAGAACMTLTDDASRFHVVDFRADADDEYLGGMFVASDAIQPASSPPTYHAPFFHFTAEAAKAFGDFGVHRPPIVVQQLLDANGLTPSDISLIMHQTSSTLLAPWKAAIQPKVFIETLASLANMTSATIPVNLDRCDSLITTENAALLALGPEPSCNVVLLHREGTGS